MGAICAVPLDYIGTICRCRTSLHYLLFDLTDDEGTTPEVMAYVRESFVALLNSNEHTLDTIELLNLMASLSNANVRSLNEDREYRKAALLRIADVLLVMRRILE